MPMPPLLFGFVPYGMKDFFGEAAAVFELTGDGAG
jgi:hypothetical protein